MGPVRFLLLTVTSLALLAIRSPAEAGWWFGQESRQDKSGLDFNRGYDVNTVTTVSGTASSLPSAIDKGPMMIEVKSGSETVTLCLGPKTFWESKGIAVRLNDELTAKGSKAQGEDGRTYLMVQTLANKSAGTQVTLRSERGDPAWSGRNAGSGRFGGGMRYQGGGMMRGGGGGGMRR